MIKHAKDTYSTMPITPSYSEFNMLDGIPCWAGIMTATMPSHPMPIPAIIEDDFTPETWLAQRQAMQAEFDADLAALRSGAVQPLAVLTNEQLGAIYEEVPGADFSTCPFEF